MVSETRFLSGGYSIFIATSNWWNIWADDNFVSQICRVCETDFCSWHRFSHVVVSSRKNLPPSLLPSSFSPRPPQSLTRGRISEFSGNLFSAWSLGEWVPVLGRERRKFLNFLPIFHSLHALRRCGVGVVREILPWLQPRDGYDVVRTAVEELVWMIKDKSP